MKHIKNWQIASSIFLIQNVRNTMQNTFSAFSFSLLFPPCPSLSLSFCVVGSFVRSPVMVIYKCMNFSCYCFCGGLFYETGSHAHIAQPINYLFVFWLLLAGAVATNCCVHYSIHSLFISKAIIFVVQYILIGWFCTLFFLFYGIDRKKNYNRNKQLTMRQREEWEKKNTHTKILKRRRQCRA